MEKVAFCTRLVDADPRLVDADPRLVDADPLKIKNQAPNSFFRTATEFPGGFFFVPGAEVGSVGEKFL